MLKKKNGVTLVALVITIIVLLILAGVSISLVVGDNGVLTQSQKASKNTDIASVDSAVQTCLSGLQSEWYGNVWVNNVNSEFGTWVTLDKINTELGKQGYKLCSSSDATAGYTNVAAGVGTGDETIYITSKNSGKADDTKYSVTLVFTKTSVSIDSSNPVKIVGS